MKLGIGVFVLSTLLLIVVGMISLTTNIYSDIRYDSLLSLVVSSESRMLKQWQDNGAIQSNMVVGSRGGK